MVPASDGSDDSIWIGGPEEGFGHLVCLLDEAFDAFCDAGWSRLAGRQGDEAQSVRQTY
jgi:hypothetical protein